MNRHEDLKPPDAGRIAVMGQASRPIVLSDPRKRRIYERLRRLVGPGPADFFHDACELMTSAKPLRSTSHLVGHAMREIESALRDVLEPAEAPPAQAPSKGKSREGTHASEVRIVLRSLGIPESDLLGVAWLKLAERDSSYALSRRAHRQNLTYSRPVDAEFRQSWGEFQAILDSVLDRFEARYASVFQQLDALLHVPAPAAAQARSLQKNVPQTFAARRYFFEQLTDPAWLQPLRDQGFFQDPPPPERDDERGTIGFPLWPESQYLARMARVESPAVRETVLGIMLQVPETENVRVHTDLADAALALPGVCEGRCVPRQTQSWRGLCEEGREHRRGFLLRIPVGPGRTSSGNRS